MPVRRPSSTLMAFAIYPVGSPLTTQHFDPDAFDPIDGYSLSMYASVCRVLVRMPGGSTREIGAALAEYDLTIDRWTRIRSGWSSRIAADPIVRGAFRRFYVDETTDLPRVMNEEGEAV